MAIICVECGYNNESGQQLETATVSDASQLEGSGMSEAEKMVARAEQAIDESPITSDDQDFGDGADSFFLAMVCVVGALILTGIGVATIFIMDAIGDQINTALISVFGSIGIYLFCAAWITIVAFKASSVHGMGCLFSGGLYCIIFGFLAGRALLMPTLICLFGIIVGLISYAVYVNSDDVAMLIQTAPQLAAAVRIV